MVLVHGDREILPENWMRMRMWELGAWGQLVIVAAGCRLATKPPVAAKSAAPTWTELPTDSTPFSLEVRHGRAILDATHDSLPENARSALRCSSCHLDGGTHEVLGLHGVYARFPQYRTRNASVVTIEDRVNDCFQRSLSGKAIPADAPQMKAIVSYLAWLSRDVPGTPSPEPSHLDAPFKALTPDTAAGRVLFGQSCAICHGVAGEGTTVATPVWGARSYNIGATMARYKSAAAFIQANMPRHAPGTLTLQEALNVAAFIDSHSRPDLPGKENDWPRGGAPGDLPYRTRGTP
jgi:thiosulfate dehydrogenase